MEPTYCLPPTLNFHIVAQCNFDCVYCYCPFQALQKKRPLSLDEVRSILRQAREAGVTRVTFAGGEPTLHPQLRAILRITCEESLVPGIVTNGWKIDREWIEKHGPHLRWLTLSLDSVIDEIAHELGRRRRGRTGGHVEHLLKVSSWLHDWNRIRPPERRIRPKLNIVVTALNADEDPTEFIRALRPERVKLLQMLPVKGENDDAKDLICPDDAFEGYVSRVRPLEAEGIEIVVENNEDMDGSYAMLDPQGRFFQRVDGRYVAGRPVLEVGIAAAFADVEGTDLEKFVRRGGVYDPGDVPDGNRPRWIAIEGLDASGKSKIARALTAHLGAVLITNPPQSLAHDRKFADKLFEAERRAWYRSANYEAAREAIATLKDGRPVAMDRSFASTVVFGAAWQERTAGPQDWPSDLPRPDLIVLLDVPESERRRRLAGRRRTMTAEEKRLRDDPGFRGRVVDGYKAMGNVSVDARGKPDEVLQEIVKLLGLTPRSEKSPVVNPSGVSPEQQGWDGDDYISPEEDPFDWPDQWVP
ncbi:MAG: viperin family antiviral radical SAM protein [Planctomycetota bacterium]|nr:viperin family antiviral radical SAM protein [Planctomycetota bacterium]